jgi:K+ transporter
MPRCVANHAPPAAAGASEFFGARRGAVGGSRQHRVTACSRRQTLLTTGKSNVARWRKMLFAYLARNARPPTAFFQLPPNRVVELGLQIEL